MSAGHEAWQCMDCGEVYDEVAGRPELGVQPGTPLSELPPDWVCPACGAPLSSYERLVID